MYRHQSLSLILFITVYDIFISTGEIQFALISVLILHYSLPPIKSSEIINYKCEPKGKETDINIKDLEQLHLLLRFGRIHH